MYREREIIVIENETENKFSTETSIMRSTEPKKVVKNVCVYYVLVVLKYEGRFFK